MIEVLLKSVFGNDHMVCDVARVSYEKQASNFSDSQNERLIRYLITHGHTSPFRHPQIQFSIRCPIYVERQLFKHQVGLCLSGNSRVQFLTPAGFVKEITIRDLFSMWNTPAYSSDVKASIEAARLLISNMNALTMVPGNPSLLVSHIKDVIYSGKKEVYKITLSDGKTITCSKDHRFLNETHKWISIGYGIPEALGVGVKLWVVDSVDRRSVKLATVVSVEEAGVEETYDLTMDSDNGPEAFFANGILVHNSANSISGRYVDFSDTYTHVKEWRKQSASSKQGSDGPIDLQDEATGIERHVIDTCTEAYSRLLNLGVSKEQARTVLPLSLNTHFIWTGSLLAFVHLFNLRIKPDAQRETAEVAYEMYKAVSSLEGQPFKASLENFGYPAGLSFDDFLKKEK